MRNGRASPPPPHDSAVKEDRMRNANRLEPADILTPEELAERLKVSINWVYEKSRTRGKHSGLPLPCLRMGRYLRFSWPDVCEWLRKAA